MNRPLEGRWQLTTFASGEVANSLLAGTSITAELAGGKLNGQAGCNSYFGRILCLNLFINDYK